jgi:hypothetical protein
VSVNGTGVRKRVESMFCVLACGSSSGRAGVDWRGTGRRCGQLSLCYALEVSKCAADVGPFCQRQNVAMAAGAGSDANNLPSALFNARSDVRRGNASCEGGVPDIQQRSHVCGLFRECVAIVATLFWICQQSVRLFHYESTIQ